MTYNRFKNAAPAEVLSPAERFHRRRERREAKLQRETRSTALERIADCDFLLERFNELKRDGGAAAGPDGVRIVDLSPSEAASLMRDLSKAIVDGTYRPGPTRPVRIPKPGTNKTRTLQLANVCDRVVGKALHVALQPAWEKVFLDCSWGFRPGRSPQEMLIALEAEMTSSDRWALAIDDVQAAFDNVPHQQLANVHQLHLAAAEPSNRKSVESAGDDDVVPPETLDLVDKVLRGRSKRRKGVDQGNSYSPTALNALLHHFLDVPLYGESEKGFWFRYADNIGFLCEGADEGAERLKRARNLLEPLGMTLKGEEGVFDLNAGDEAQLLGFTLRRKGDRLNLGLGDRALDRLEQTLRDAHRLSRPIRAAEKATLGWIDAMGPAFDKGDAQILEVQRVASRAGFRELDPDKLRERWFEAYRKWESLRMKSLHERDERVLS